MEKPEYTCSECGMAVIVLNGEIIRACPHKEAVVFASMEAVVTGESSLEQSNGQAPS